MRIVHTGQVLTLFCANLPGMRPWRRGSRCIFRRVIGSHELSGRITAYGKESESHCHRAGVQRSG